MKNPILSILVIDDEPSIQTLLKTSLEHEGFQTKLASNAAEGSDLLKKHPEVAAILLDLGLPDRSGIELLSNLRSQGLKMPILVITVADDDEQKVLALDSGADDYLTKPFSIPELMARIRVAIRHSTGNPLGKIIRTGNLEINILAHQVTAHEKEVKLTSLEFKILSLLATNLGKVVTHQTLLQKIWGPHSVEHVQYLRVHLGQVRKKLKEHGLDDLLITESGVGYRLLLK